MPRLKRLSLKQKKFISGYLKTGNATEAALQAYNTKSRQVAQPIGAQNLDKPEILAEIDKALKKNNITMDGVTERVKELAHLTPDKVSSDTVLKANIELLKLLKAYPDKINKSEHKSITMQLSSKNFQDLIDLHKKTSSEIEDIVNS